MTAIATRAHVTRRTLVIAVATAAVVALVVGVFGGRWWADQQRYDRCVANATDDVQWTPESIEAVCSMEPGAVLEPAH